LLPYYYDTPRVKRILGRDGQSKQVIVHAGNPQEAAKVAVTEAMGEASNHDLSAGRYDVRVKAGVSYASQRQQDQELVANALQTNPALFQIIGDLFFKTLDSPIAERISQRLAKALPPELKDPQEGQPPPIPPQVQQQMQQMDQMIQLLTQRLNEMTDEQKAKREELASKERIAEIQAKTEMAITQAKIAADQATVQLQLETQARTAQQKVASDVAKTERQIESTEAQAEADRGAEQAIALLNARIKQIEQMVAIDMARLQAASQSSTGSSATPAPPSPPTAAPPSPDVTLPPMPAPSATSPQTPELAG